MSYYLTAIYWFFRDFGCPFRLWWHCEFSLWKGFDVHLAMCKWMAELNEEDRKSK
jgi:hypothetical protein